MSSVLFIKIVIMTNLNRCANHITMIDDNYITIYNFYLNILNIFKISIYTSIYYNFCFYKI